MTEDVNAEAVEVVDNAVNVGCKVYNKLERDYREFRARRNSREFSTVYDGRALMSAERARGLSKSRDATAGDVLAWEAFTESRRRSTLMPGATELKGAPSRKKAASQAAGFRVLRQAYEMETGKSAATGNPLSKAEIASRKKWISPDFQQEAKNLKENYVDSRLAMKGNNMLNAAREEEDNILPSPKVVRKSKELVR